jgi:hypothetical protein
VAYNSIQVFDHEFTDLQRQVLELLSVKLDARPRARFEFESHLVLYTHHMMLLQHPTNTVN